MPRQTFLMVVVLSVALVTDGCAVIHASPGVISQNPSVNESEAVTSQGDSPPLAIEPALGFTAAAEPPASRDDLVPAETPRLERLPPLDQFAQDLHQFELLRVPTPYETVVSVQATAPFEEGYDHTSSPHGRDNPALLPARLGYDTRDVRTTRPLEIEETTYLDLAEEQWSGVCADHANFYSFRSLTWIGVGLGAGAAMANTRFDESFLHDTYSENVVLAPTNEYYEKLHQPEFLGNGYYTLPIFAAAALAEPLIEGLPLGEETSEWGQRSLRTVLVGGPPMLGLQLLTGASRPNETDKNSQWTPLQDNNGVSGHSFMGAVPFLSAAKMTENLWLKSGLYVASTLPALSRVNDDRHYFSQAFLGWWIAYAAATAVDHSHRPDSHYHFFAYPTRGGAGMGVDIQY